MLTGYAMPQLEAFDSNCPAPSNITVAAKSSGSISFDWDGVDAATYEVYYVRQSDGYTSSVSVTGNSDFTFSGLSAGTYDFFFRTGCVGAMSEWIGVEETVVN